MAGADDDDGTFVHIHDGVHGRNHKARQRSFRLALDRDAGISSHMGEMRKITAFLPADLIDSAMASSGLGLTETLRVALREHNHRAASRRLLEMRGKVPFELDWRDLRGKDEE